MDVIGLNRQLDHIPSLRMALLFQQLLTAFFDFANKNGFTPFGAPDEMIQDQMYTVFISLVL